MVNYTLHKANVQFLIEEGILVFTDYTAAIANVVGSLFLVISLFGDTFSRYVNDVGVQK